MQTHLVQTIIEALEPIAGEQGFELVDVQVAGTTRTPTLRVFIDKPEGLTLDDIAAANSWINVCIDEIDPFRGSFLLEVSSPGIDRPLRTREHFERFAGQIVHIVTRPKKQEKQEQEKSRSKWTGLLRGIEEHTEGETEGTFVLVEVDGAVQYLDFSEIKKAHIKGTVDFKKEPDRKPKTLA